MLRRHGRVTVVGPSPQASTAHGHDSGLSIAGSGPTRGSGNAGINLVTTAVNDGSNVNTVSGQKDVTTPVVSTQAADELNDIARSYDEVSSCAARVQCVLCCARLKYPVCAAARRERACGATSWV